MNKIIFNKEQEQILLGSLLGDGCIHKRKNTEKDYKYSEVHSLKQKDYLLWKNKYLNFNLFKYLNLILIQKGNITFKQYYDLFYPNGKKIVTREILDKLELLGLVVWYLDDGSYNYGFDNLTISTHSFKLIGNQIIKKWFKDKFNIDCKIQKVKIKKDKMYINKVKVKKFKHISYLIYINSKNTKRFIELIKFYVLQIPSMVYKIGLDEDKKVKAKNKNKETKKKYFIKNKDRIKKKQKIWAKKNKDKLNKKARERYKTNPKYKIANKLKARIWRKNNPFKSSKNSKRYYQKNKSNVGYDVVID